MPVRPALRPGAPLLRRDARHLQLGTSPGIVIRDRPGLVRLLRLLDGVRDVPRLTEVVAATIPELDGELGPLLDELRSLGAVFDASRWAVEGRPGAAEARHADLAHRGTSLERRAASKVAVHPDATSAGLARTARQILRASGVTELDADDPDLLVVVACGEPSRLVFERPVLDRIDHLPVVVDEDRVRIGPLVRPGRTPCVACHDLHRTDWDRAWTALVPQLGRQSATLTPPAVSAVTMHAAAVELAVEILAHVDGGTPRTIGACLSVGPEHGDRALWPVAFHHGCACDLLSAA